MLTQQPTCRTRTPRHFFLLPAGSETNVGTVTDKIDAPMDVNEFRQRGKELIDFICDYHLGLQQRPPSISVFAPSQSLPDIISDGPPTSGVPWEHMIADLSKQIIPGVTPWQHPYFYSFFPHGHSFPSVCAELLSAGLGSVTFRNDISPSLIELDDVVLRWMAKLLNLPNCLVSSKDSQALIMGSAGDAMNAAVQSARNVAIRRHMTAKEDEFDILRRLVIFCSSEAHLTVRKAARLFMVELRVIPTDKRGILCPRLLKKAMKDEISNGKIPCLVTATVGTTSTCAIDPINEIGAICRRYKCWFHIDGAYAGAACICPEYRSWLDGAELADSLVINAHKWLLVHFDCAMVWMKNFSHMKFTNQKMNSLYQYHEKFNGNSSLDLMNYQVPFGRRFRALKLWMVLSSYGSNGIQKHIRSHVCLAREFENSISEDEMFEVTDSRAGLVCFRMRAGLEATKKLEDAIRTTGTLDVRSATQPGTDDKIIRFAICSPYTTSNDIQFAVRVIKGCAFLVNSPKQKRQSTIQRNL